MRDSVGHTTIHIIADSIKELHERAAGVAASHPNCKGKCACVETMFAQAFFCFYKNNEQLLNGKEKTFARY